jgi:3-isopropylmalate/(R)-2-methylmalate dehydratase small subunit
VRAIVGESFAEIFLGNCVAMGIPCVIAASETVKELQDQIVANPQTVVEVNLETQQVQCGEVTGAIALNEGSRNMFLSGTWDACGQLVSQANQIRATAAKLPYVQWSQAMAR